MPSPKSWFGRGNTRALLISGGILALFISGSALAVGEGEPVEGGERNPTANQTEQYEQETLIIGDIAATTEQVGGYVTRQSNTRTGADAGGAAIYGCRSTGINTDTDESCLRANNLADGLAFSFDSNGTLGGIINVGDGGREEKPFTTNATGVATGLNADEVDGLDAEEIVAAARGASGSFATRWALVNNEGVIIRQTGGFETLNCYDTNANCYIDAGENVTDNAITAQILTSNMPDSGTDGVLTGEISAAPCNFDFVACLSGNPDEAAAEGDDGEVFVVAPRNSDGSDPGEGDRYFFYVTISDTQANASLNQDEDAAQDPDVETTPAP